MTCHEKSGQSFGDSVGVFNGVPSYRTFEFWNGEPVVCVGLFYRSDLAAIASR